MCVCVSLGVGELESEGVCASTARCVLRYGEAKRSEGCDSSVSLDGVALFGGVWQVRLWVWGTLHFSIWINGGCFSDASILAHEAFREPVPQTAGPATLIADKTGARAARDKQG